MRSKTLRDLNADPVRDVDVPWGLSRIGGALLPSQENLLLDSFTLPLEYAPAGKVVCSYCAETGETVDTVQHQDWCVYLDGPVCPEIPN